MFRKMTVFLTLASFLASCFVFPQPAGAQLFMPQPGEMVAPSQAGDGVALRGIKINPSQPMRFEFLISSANNPNIKESSQRLIKYFLACLSLPEEDLWVNLSPYEKDKMIPQTLGQTELGRDLLAQDYVLKQLTASLIDPRKELGKEFWARIYKKAQEQFGTTEVPVNTFNKVWILADTAKVFVNKNEVYVVNSHMKVMLEEDYLAHSKNEMPSDTGLNAKATQGTNGTPNVANQVVRDIILPEIEKEVNAGEHFAPLRQIFNAFILASWYKKNLKKSILNQVYSDKGKAKGLSFSKQEQPVTPDAIYQQYLKAYKKGVFNFIQDPDPSNLGYGATSLPRKYFSGGTVFRAASFAQVSNPVQLTATDFTQLSNVDFAVTADLKSADIAPDAATVALPSSHQYMVANDEQRRLVYEAIKSETQQGQRQYIKRFRDIVDKGLLTLDFELKKLESFPDQERIFHTGLLQDEDGVYWIVKQKEGGLNVEWKNIAHREYFVSLIMSGRANMAEIRLLSYKEASQLPFIDQTKIGEYYLTRVVTAENVKQQSLIRDPSKAFSTNLVAHLFLGKNDQHLLNWAFAGTPISVDHDLVGFSIDEGKLDKPASLIRSLWEHAVLRLVAGLKPSLNSPFYDDLKVLREMRDHRQRMGEGEDMRSFHSIFTILEDFNFGQGYINAEQLNPEYIRESIKQMKAITPQEIHSKALEAGYSADKARKLVQYLELQQRMLGSMLDLYFSLLTKTKHDFYRLDDQDYREALFNPAMSTSNVQITEEERQERRAVAVRSIGHGEFFKLSPYDYMVSMMDDIRKEHDEKKGYDSEESKIYRRFYNLQNSEVLKRRRGELGFYNEFFDSMKEVLKIIDEFIKTYPDATNNEFIVSYVTQLRSRVEQSEGILSNEVFQVTDTNNIRPFVSVHSDFKGDLSGVQLNGNRYSFYSAINNILGNGEQAAEKKFGDDSKKAQFKAIFNREGNNLVVRIIDNGPGLSPEMLASDPIKGQKIFVLNNSTKGEAGTGLGTTEAWYAIKDMGGTIVAGNRTDGVEGAEFVITIPIASPAMSSDMWPEGIPDAKALAQRNPEYVVETLRRYLVKFRATEQKKDQAVGLQPEIREEEREWKGMQWPKDDLWKFYTYMFNLSYVAGYAFYPQVTPESAARDLGGGKYLAGLYNRFRNSVLLEVRDINDMQKISDIAFRIFDTEKDLWNELWNRWQGVLEDLIRANEMGTAQYVLDIVQEWLKNDIRYKQQLLEDYQWAKNMFEKAKGQGFADGEFKSRAKTPWRGNASKDYYAILGLAKDATQGQIKSAYWKLAKKFHPDLVQGDKKTSEEKMKEINEAYEVLSDSDKRQRYDELSSRAMTSSADEAQRVAVYLKQLPYHLSLLDDEDPRIYFPALAAVGRIAERLPPAHQEARDKVVLKLYELLKTKMATDDFFKEEIIHWLISIDLNKQRTFDYVHHLLNEGSSLEVQSVLRGLAGLERHRVVAGFKQIDSQYLYLFLFTWWESIKKLLESKDEGILKSVLSYLTTMKGYYQEWTRGLGQRPVAFLKEDVKRQLMKVRGLIKDDFSKAEIDDLLQEADANKEWESSPSLPKTDGQLKVNLISPEQLVSDFIKEGRRVICLNAGLSYILLQGRVNGLLDQIVTRSGITHIALPYPEASRQIIEDIVAGKEVDMDLLGNPYNDGLWLFGKDFRRAEEGVTRVFLENVYRHGIKVMLYDNLSAGGLLGELRAIRRSQEIVKVAKADPEAKILVLGSLSMGRTSLLGIQRSEHTVAWQLTRELGEKKIASIVVEKHNLLPGKNTNIPVGFYGFKVPGSPVAEHEYFIYRTKWHQAWDGAIVYKKPNGGDPGDRSEPKVPPANAKKFEPQRELLVDTSAAALSLVNRAMISKPAETGGIDLKAQDLKLTEEGAGWDAAASLDPALLAQLSSPDFTGLTAVIIDIKPFQVTLQ